MEIWKQYTKRFLIRWIKLALFARILTSAMPKIFSRTGLFKILKSTIAQLVMGKEK